MLLGAIGLPVFASFTGGLNIITGATGGYIIGFVFMAFIIGYFIEKDKKSLAFIGAYLGLSLIHISCIKQKDFREAKESIKKVEDRMKILKDNNVDTDYLDYLYEGIKKKIK